MDDRNPNPASRERLTGRKIIITGGCSGIGAATAQSFAREGASVAIFDLNPTETAGTKGGMGQISTFKVDIADRADVARAMAAAVENLGGLDGLVNCAGIATVAPFLETTDDMWDRTIGVNLTGAFNVTKAAVPHLQRATGQATIVNVISGTALLPFKDLSAYIASKAGLQGFSKALAFELGPKIRVNIVSPGPINTPLQFKTYPSAEEQSSLMAKYVLKELGKPTDVADAILFLSSSEAAFIVGATLVVDGGRTFH
jgi:NAD(P)-dependent dehydrogenase (short-subunit alcohol dehydrogenase family)